jgi:hypothetical protein
MYPHELVIRYPQTHCPSVNRVCLELELFRAETLQDWIELCQRQTNPVEQKEMMRHQENFCLGICAFATLVIQQGKDKDGFKYKTKCAIPQYNEWFLLDPSLETTGLVKPNSKILDVLQREVFLPETVASLTMKYLEFPLGKRLLYISQIKGQSAELETYWSSLFCFEFGSSIPEAYIKRWILQKINQQVKVLHLNRITGELVPKKVTKIRIGNHFFKGDSHSCPSCDNPWAVEWVAIKIDNCPVWVQHSSFKTRPWVDPTKQDTVKWNGNRKNRFYHFCSHWVQPYPVKRW